MIKTEAKGFVYALRHNPTGKIYVGCTKNVERRIHQHIVQLANNNHPIEAMQQDFNDYPVDYSYYVLFEAFAAYDAHLMEKHFMSLLGTRDPEKGYNFNDNSCEFSLDNFRKRKVYLTAEVSR